MSENETGRNWLKASLDIKALVVLGAAGATALATGIFLLLPLALLAYGAIVWNNLREQGESIYQLDKADLKGLQPYYVGRMQQVRAVQEQIIEEVKTAGEDVRIYLRPSLEKIKDLGRKHAYLLRTLQDLERYLSSVNVQYLERERHAINQKREATRDELSRAHYDRALQSLADKIRNYEEILTGRERIDSQLESIRLSLESIHGQILRVKTADVRQATVQYDNVNNLLDGLNVEVDSLTESMDQVFAQVRMIQQ